MSSLQTLASDEQPPCQADSPAAAPAAGTDHMLAAPLTARQCQVLALLCEGLSDKLIARQLNLSHHTVRGHVQILYGLLRVSTRMQAMLAARRHGLFG
ncbi:MULTISPECIES: LuxR C-terminal-related transcriptional regulator [unclassified Polaromonas]|jgi:DNA-binding NarL/FixJ family response regulator|uniref:response regulator transcription factor n=1 Tax=unclassified Polaromonas TaxID=2638319 RepID=UPI000BCEBD7D|nr:MULTISPECIES: LuxR C-terminal-related transcriptional regulator [unclassified Polaromonas]OYY35108.1 MAG: hypothetical protein B7Y60_14655 [Polaromonas sp. 35-63-35]OYZ20246.1 MAG: hypothetical protein B7Y28_10025 [Polaromonas sp. 16-63-31]OYZ78000.1 MAG: hypothetical protein B7Y09_14850 [Polaromonas sp. 24-63-21]OZA49510.1 MAG: hypothetical protein B7X88_13865 [Polaromonas sp. 17-63-33]OZA87358.1 MAG: hypothetical protein B7X65_12605 [Polaromonas sp. 39-63-25]